MILVTPGRRTAVGVSNSHFHWHRRCLCTTEACRSAWLASGVTAWAIEAAARDCRGTPRLSSFQTPDEERWRQVFRTCREHLGRGGALSRMPHANQIWMLYGFELFEALRAIGHEVIEVYPYAIVRALLPECPHKRTAEGYRRQLELVAAATNWSPLDLERALKRSVPGTKDDRLDAFMAAWVAGLSKHERRAYGNENDPDDAIWVPR